jgi:hypothetical protein
MSIFTITVFEQLYFCARAAKILKNTKRVLKTKMICKKTAYFEKIEKVEEFCEEKVY